MIHPVDEQVLHECEVCGKPLLAKLIFNNGSFRYMVFDCEHYKWGLFSKKSSPAGNPVKIVELRNCIAGLYRVNDFPPNTKTRFKGMYLMDEDEMDEYLKTGKLPQYIIEIQKEDERESKKWEKKKTRKL